MTRRMIYRPELATGFTRLEAQRYLRNVFAELDEISFTADERNKLSQAAVAKLVNEKTRSFFFYHFLPLYVRAVHALFTRQRPLLVDLGCGSGSVSILFGMLGAKVVGIDVDSALIDACRKKLEFYRGRDGEMDVTFHNTSVFDFDYTSLDPIDGIHSLFAFNLMQPSSKLLALAASALKPGGRIVISDGNRSSIVNRLFRRRSVLTPSQMRRELALNGCETVSTEYNCVLPPVATRIAPVFAAGRGVESVLSALRVTRWLGVSYTIVAEKRG